jgi:hypothetical protein
MQRLIGLSAKHSGGFGDLRVGDIPLLLVELLQLLFQHYSVVAVQSAVVLCLVLFH